MSVALNEIEKEWDVSKILVTQNSDPKYLSYVLGRHDIYVHKMHPIVTNLERSVSEQPLMVDVRSKPSAEVQNFILTEKQFKSYKIFKHGDHFFEPEDAVGLVANTTKNILNFFEIPVTFYIDCQDRILRKMFYDIALRINLEDGNGHSFDYDKYDYKLIVKKYETYMEDMGPVYTGFSLFTVLTGPKMPNYWNQEHTE